MNDLKNIISKLGDEYMSRFRVFHAQTLFEPSWVNLKQNRCPLCGCKLKQPRGRIVAICKSVKHGKPFIIAVEKLNTINSKHGDKPLVKVTIGDK